MDLNPMNKDEATKLLVLLRGTVSLMEKPDQDMIQHMADAVRRMALDNSDNCQIAITMIVLEISAGLIEKEKQSKKDVEILSGL